MKVVDIVREYLKRHDMEGLCEDDALDYDPESSCTCRLGDLMSHCSGPCTDCMPVRMNRHGLVTKYGTMTVESIVEQYMAKHSDMALLSCDGECGCGISYDSELFVCGGVWRDCETVKKETE